MIKTETNIRCYIVKDSDYLIGKEEFFILDRFTDDFSLKVNGMELIVDFNKYMVVISNFISGDWETYMEEKVEKLGVIALYNESTISYRV